MGGLVLLDLPSLDELASPSLVLKGLPRGSGTTFWFRKRWSNNLSIEINLYILEWKIKTQVKIWKLCTVCLPDSKTRSMPVLERDPFGPFIISLTLSLNFVAILCRASLLSLSVRPNSSIRKSRTWSMKSSSLIEWPLAFKRWKIDLREIDIMSWRPKHNLDEPKKQKKQQTKLNISSIFARKNSRDSNLNFNWEKKVAILF